VSQQIAGDLLEHSGAQDRRDAITATGFLALGPTNYELQDKNQLRMDVVDEQIDTVGRAFMGMSLGCARCHDHFFDPIPTADYYALAGIFRSTKTLEHSNVSKWISTKLPPSGETELAAQRERDQFDRQSAQLRVRIGELKEKLKTQARSRSPGIVVDDRNALLEGAWTDSTFAKGYFGDRYIHDAGNQTGQRAVFRQMLPKAGEYDVRVAYTALGNRTSIAIATVQHPEGEAVIRFDQREQAPLDGFRSLGAFRFDAETPAEVVLTNGSTGAGVLIVDAVAFVPLDGRESEQIQKEAAEGHQAELARLESELKQLGKQKPPGASVAMSVVDEATPADHAINVGGNTMNLGAEVPRGYLTVASRPGASRPSIPEGQSGRRELAHWLTSPDHPLVARVYVNRVWYWLTGEGIVATPNDFGSTGQPPSNPPLLDYLADFLTEHEFSTKALVRFIVSSSTYRTASESPRRIDAETIRDAILLVSRELDLAHASGPAIKGGTKSEFGYRFDSTHRSVFAPVFRNNLPELFQVFDFPDPSLSSGARSDTTLATQALYMMNHPWVIARSQAAAKHWLQVGDHPMAIVRAAYQATLSRPPDDSELELSLSFLGESPDVEKVTQFQQSLFASIDFRHY
jgi:hypothetical protein